MFQQLRNIETAFKHVRLFTFVVVTACIVICCFTVYESYRMVTDAQERIYLLAEGTALEALSAGTRENLPVEMRSHVKMFHHYFFTLDPDEEVIRENISRALYLADNSAARQHDNLKESNYYSRIISGNVSQRVKADSIVLDTRAKTFRYYGTQKLIRPTSVVTRSLVTEGRLRKVSRSDNNPHGLLIERWRILENKDLNVQTR